MRGFFIFLAIFGVIFAADPKAAPPPETIRWDRQKSGVFSDFDENNSIFYALNGDFFAAPNSLDHAHLIAPAEFYDGIFVFSPTNPDLRGAGLFAHKNIKIIQENIAINPLLGLNGSAKFFSISPVDFSNFKILPGSNVVLHGSGAKNGVILVEKNRIQRKLGASANFFMNFTPVRNAVPIFNVETRLGMRGRMGLLSKNLFFSMNTRFLFKSAPREKDESKIGNFNASLLFRGENYKIFTDLIFVHFDAITTPYNLFSLPDEKNMTNFLQKNNAPDPKTSHRAGIGKINDGFLRYAINLGLDYQFSTRTLLEANFFIARDILNFVAHRKQIWQKIMKNNKHEYNFDALFDETFSRFAETKIGTHVKITHKFNDNIFVAGADIIAHTAQNMHARGDGASRDFQDLHAKNSANNFYALQNTKFGALSLAYGARYEFSKTFGNGGGILKTTHISGIFPLNFTSHNFALNFSPRYSFDLGDARGDFFAKYERGFSPIPPDFLHIAQDQKAVPTALKTESFHAAETGVRLLLRDILSIHASIFYTLSQNEIFLLGYPNSFREFFLINLPLTHRAGFEFVAKQVFFDENVIFSQSFSFTDARILKNSNKRIKTSVIPYAAAFRFSLFHEFLLPWDFGIQINAHMAFGARDITGREIPILPFFAPFLDVSISEKFGRFKITAGVKNAFGIIDFLHYNSDDSDFRNGSNYAAGAKRSYFFSGSYDF